MDFQKIIKFATVSSGIFETSKIIFFLLLSLFTLTISLFLGDPWYILIFFFVFIIAIIILQIKQFIRIIHTQKGEKRLNKMNHAKRKIPTGVKIISIFYYIGAVIGVVLALLIIFTGSKFGSFFKDDPLISSLGIIIFIVFGIIAFGMSVFSFLIAKGLGKTKPWARWVVIVFMGLSVLGAIFIMIKGQIISGLLSLVFALVIGGYLLLNKKVKEIFD